MVVTVAAYESMREKERSLSHAVESLQEHQAGNHNRIVALEESVKAIKDALSQGAFPKVGRELIRDSFVRGESFVPLSKEEVKRAA